MNERALLICPQGRGAEKLKALLAENQLRDSEVATSGGEARRLISAKSYAVAVVNAPLADESGIELAMELTEGSVTAALVLVKAELMGLVFSSATEAGVLVLAKPLNPALFSQALGLGLAMHHRLCAMEGQRERLEKKLEESRVVDRAKCLLIQRMKLTEEEAHRMIEKQAMDMRLPKIRIAKELLRKLEL